MYKNLSRDVFLAAYNDPPTQEDLIALLKKYTGNNFNLDTKSNCDEAVNICRSIIAQINDDTYTSGQIKAPNEERKIAALSMLDGLLTDYITSTFHPPSNLAPTLSKFG